MDIILKIKYSPAAARLRLQSARSTHEIRIKSKQWNPPHGLCELNMHTCDLESRK